MLVLAHLHRSVLTQQVHSLGHLAFKWRSSFAKALAKLSPNFCEKSPDSFYKMIHIYIINTKYKYLQCNLDMCTWTFAKTFARKKNTFAISEKKTLAETVNCIPKGLRKGNPFQGPFAQLSHMRPTNLPARLLDSVGPTSLPNYTSSPCRLPTYSPTICPTMPPHKFSNGENLFFTLPLGGIPCSCHHIFICGYHIMYICNMYLYYTHTLPHKLQELIRFANIRTCAGTCHEFTILV